MLDLKQLQSDIVKYIEENYQNYLNEYNIYDFIIRLDFLDLDRFKNNFNIFIDFNKINFNQSKFTDDCCKSMQFQVSFYLVHRNDKSENLMDRMLNSATAFCKLMNDDISFAQELIIESLQNYNIVEGTQNIVISEFNIRLDIEI